MEKGCLACVILVLVFIVGACSAKKSDNISSEIISSDLSETASSEHFAALSGISTEAETSGKGEDDVLSDTELYEMEAVDDAIRALFDSEGFADMGISEKSEKMLSLIYDIARNGTEDFPYSLIKESSIYYDERNGLISFEYSCGALGGAKLKPFDPMLN